MNKYLFSIGCGSNPSVRYAAEYVYSMCYRGAAAGYGLIYSDLRYIMYNSELYYDGDWVHPNRAGTDTIANAIFNTLLGNSSILTPFYKSYFGNIGGSTYGIGNLFTVNSNLAQFNLNFIQINYGKIQQIGAFGEFDICKIDNLIPFGHVKGSYFDLNPILVTFKNGDIVENVTCNFHLTKIINQTDSNEISAGTRPSVACRYDTYLTLCNSTPRTFEFTELYMHNGIINIHSCF